jgi:hypothetical protein
MKYYNTNDTYGGSGPFEAESKEALADQMHATFQAWALEAVLKRDDIEPTARDWWVSESIDQMRAEFIAGLEEV